MLQSHSAPNIGYVYNVDSFLFMGVIVCGPQNNQNLKGQSEINDSVIFNASSFSFPIQVSFRNYLPVPHTSRVLSSQLHCTYIYLASNIFHYVIIQCLNTNTF